MRDAQWFTEYHSQGYGLTIRMDKVLVDTESEYQKILIFENKDFGKVFVLDGAVMLTERDEFTYHEMVVHPALMAHPNPEKVLIIGGGDGGTLREVVKHPEVGEATLCEIDQDVIDYSKEFLPFTASGLTHPKSSVYVGDGIEYIRNHQNCYDVVIVDSTDPVGFAEGLFRAPFYTDVKNSLRKGGIFVQQTESPFYNKDVWEKIYQELNQVFNNIYPYHSSIPMYPSGHWTFGMAFEKGNPWENFNPERIKHLGQLNYYSEEHQKSAFNLPQFADEIFKRTK